MSDVLQAILGRKREVIDAVVDGNVVPDEPVSLAVVRALRARGGDAASGDAPAPTDG